MYYALASISFPLPASHGQRCLIAHPVALCRCARNTKPCSVPDVAVKCFVVNISLCKVFCVLLWSSGNDNEGRREIIENHKLN